MGDPFKYFFIEAGELLEHLTRDLLHLEKTPDDPELIKKLFRYVHTLKGAASVVKLSGIKTLSHRMEDRLARFRDRSAPVSAADVTLLLEAAARLGAMVEKVKAGEGEDPEDAADLLARLEGGERAAVNAAPAPESAPAARVSAAAPPPEVSAPARKPAGQAKAQPGEAGRSDGALRIGRGRMDRLTDLSNEILVNYFRLKNAADLLTRTLKQRRNGARPGLRRTDEQTFLSELEAIARTFEERLSRTGLFSHEMNDLIMNARLVAMESQAFHFEKALRDIGLETGREVRFAIEGGDILLDRSLLENLKEPVYHMLRNCVTHGVEPAADRLKKGKPAAGAVRLSFEKADKFIRIIIEDDGRGLDPAAIRRIAVEKRLIDAESADRLSDEEAFYLILRSGFSSAETLTEFAGRGVGLDVVKNAVSELGGSMHIASRRGEFTRFTLRMPAMVNMTDAFMVNARGCNILIPLRNVLETRIIRAGDVAMEAGHRVILYNQAPIPLVPLDRIFGLDAPAGLPRKTRTVIVKGNVDVIALTADELVGKKSILLKPLKGRLKQAPCIDAAAILENGDPAFVLNVFKIFDHLRDAPARPAEERPAPPPARILVADDSLTTRTLINGILAGEGYRVRLAQSGEEAMDILERDAFDLILADIEMPGMDGFELSRNIRRSPKDKDTPIIILTSLASDADKRRGVEVGANAYIVKGSFDQESFLDTVESVL